MARRHSPGRFRSRVLWRRLPSVLCRAALLIVLAVTLSASESSAQSSSVDAGTDATASCLKDLGALDEAYSRTYVTGIIADDAACVSSQRDPASSETFYARRHSFTLDGASTVSVELRYRPGRATDPKPYFLLLEGSSTDGTGTVVGHGAYDADSRTTFGYLLLAAGTYTVEVTTVEGGLSGNYRFSLTRQAEDPCVRDFGTARVGTTQATGIVAVDPSCISAQREPATASVYYARRHTFTLESAAEVAVYERYWRGFDAQLLLLEGTSADGSGRVLARSQERDAAGVRVLNRVALVAGNYTIEVSSSSAGGTGEYQIWLSSWEAESCGADFGTLSESVSSVGVLESVALEAECVASHRGPNGEKYDAHRHTFTLDDAAIVSLSAWLVSGTDYEGAPPISYLSVAGLSVDDDSTGLPTPWYPVDYDYFGHSNCGEIELCEAYVTAEFTSGDFDDPLQVALPAGRYAVELSSLATKPLNWYYFFMHITSFEGCMRDLGGLGPTSALLAVEGIVAIDSGCIVPETDTLYDDSYVHYARRYSFTLDNKATVALKGIYAGRGYFAIRLLQGSSADGSATVVDEVQVYEEDHRLVDGAGIFHVLDAGTYTAEVSVEPAYDNKQTGFYKLHIEWQDTGECVSDLGSLPALIHSKKTVPVNESCVSPRHSNEGDSPHYARRHTFEIEELSTVSVYAPKSTSALGYRYISGPEIVILNGSSADGTGTVLAGPVDQYEYRGRGIVGRLLQPGTYTVEVTHPAPSSSFEHWLYIRRDPPRRGVSVFDATATEGDEAMVFTVMAEPPPIGTSPNLPSSVQWSTAPGTASRRSDYRGRGLSSGQPSTIAPSGRRSTITVQLDDDEIAEDTEWFSVHLGEPVRVAIADGIATGTIIDDDPAAPATDFSDSTCPAGKVSAAVGDVADVAQPGYSQWTDVFVDVKLTCAGGIRGAGGYQTGVEVLRGRSALHDGGWCVSSGTAAVTSPASDSGNCTASVLDATLDPRVDARVVVTRMESTHIVRIQDTAVGEPRQFRAWLDLDKDGVRDNGEPAHIFATDLTAHGRRADGTADFGLPEDFYALRRKGSTVVGRAGRFVTLRLRLLTPGRERFESERFGGAVTAPMANTRVGAFVVTGPSQVSPVTCRAPHPPVSTAAARRASSGCVTNSEGDVVLQYQVQPTAINAGPQQDDVTLYWDSDDDGFYDAGASDGTGAEASTTVQVPIAKAVNYVALGDSYSSGEQGRDDAPDFLEEYENDPDSADSACRRWTLAYPNVFKDKILRDVDPKIDVSFVTFACSGAVTRNVYDPADPDGTSTAEEHLATNRPSPSAPMLMQREPHLGARWRSVIKPPDWEPRQAESLRLRRVHLKQALRDIDMITITIGGNDANFSDVLTACMAPDTFQRLQVGVSSQCISFVPGGLDELMLRLTSVIEALSSAAPRAAIFVMGYAPVTPFPTPCSVGMRVWGIRGCQWVFTNRNIDRCPALDSRQVITTRFGGPFAQRFAGSLKIDHLEAGVLWERAKELNQTLERAAQAADAHFVAVAGFAEHLKAGANFIGHDPCGSEPWLHGVVHDAGSPGALSGRSFHPNAAGHHAYAQILYNYIEDVVSSGVGLNDAGLPIHPEPEQP